MNKLLAKQTKEYMLEIKDWCLNPNRKLSLDCINEIAEEVLSDLNLFLVEEEEREKATGEWDTRHLEAEHLQQTNNCKCIGADQDQHDTDDCDGKVCCSPQDKNPDWDPVKDS